LDYGGSERGTVIGHRHSLIRVLAAIGLEMEMVTVISSELNSLGVIVVRAFQLLSLLVSNQQVKQLF
jgi:hypothetical protein